MELNSPLMEQIKQISRNFTQDSPCCAAQLQNDATLSMSSKLTWSQTRKGVCQVFKSTHVKYVLTQNPRYKDIQHLTDLFLINVLFLSIKPQECEIKLCRNERYQVDKTHMRVFTVLSQEFSRKRHKT